MCIVGPLVRAGHSVGVAHYTRAPAQDLAGMLRQRKYSPVPMDSMCGSERMVRSALRW